MLKFTLLFILFFNISYAEKIDWNQFKGCYITKEVNGKKMRKIKYWNDGSLGFKNEKAFAVLKPDRSELQTLSFFMSVEGTGLDAEVLPVEVFLGFGNNSKKDDYLIHEYTGRLPYALKNGSFLNYDLLTKIKRLDKSHLELVGHVKFKVYGGDKKSHLKYKAKVQKVNCANSNMPYSGFNVLQPIQNKNVPLMLKN